ncbi:helix-turn-helix domain-containing protein [Desulfotomaculum copahuensis]|uniref:helix-turn-helix transcriptional regulator n=1 Tax=Desulfotomaculum copahuensis TaxID=1838280 RepID=UPI00098FBCDC
MALLNVKELTGYLKVSERTIFQWRKEGLPCIKFQGRRIVRYDMDEVMKWLDNRKVVN